uniref:Uncharacterized protein n=1 Tax=Timema tahoe TaxID=61484 RepID=A0A7R9IHR6_9NEOP|nr:unnamed protein product [Timema tahoe]
MKEAQAKFTASKSSKVTHFSPGDLVWVHSVTHRKFKAVPGEIQHRVSTVSYLAIVGGRSKQISTSHLHLRDLKAVPVELPWEMIEQTMPAPMPTPTSDGPTPGPLIQSPPVADRSLPASPAPEPSPDSTPESLRRAPSVMAPAHTPVRPYLSVSKRVCPQSSLTKLIARAHPSNNSLWTSGHQTPMPSLCLCFALVGALFVFLSRSLYLIEIKNINGTKDLFLCQRRHSLIEEADPSSVQQPKCDSDQIPPVAHQMKTILTLYLFNQMIIRLDQLKRNCSGCLYGIMCDNSLLVVGFNITENQQEAPSEEQDQINGESYFKLTLPGEVEPCGLFTSNVDLDEERKAVLLDGLREVEVTDNPVLLTYSSEGEAPLKSQYIINDNLCDTELHVLTEEEFWKQFVCIRVQGFLKVSCDVKKDVVLETLQEIGKEIAGGSVGFEFPHSSLYLVSDSSVCEDSVDKLLTDSLGTVNNRKAKKGNTHTNNHGTYLSVTLPHPASLSGEGRGPRAVGTDWSPKVRVQSLPKRVSSQVHLQIPSSLREKKNTQLLHLAVFARNHTLHRESSGVSNWSATRSCLRSLALDMQPVRRTAEVVVLDARLHFLQTSEFYCEMAQRMAPVIIYSKRKFSFMELKFKMDCLTLVPRKCKSSNLYGMLLNSVERHIKRVERCFLEHLDGDTTPADFIPQAFHFLPPGCGHFVTLVYPKNKTPDQLSK